MPRRVVVTERFARSYQKLPLDGQQTVDSALHSLKRYMESGQAEAGLGLKRLHRRTCECRAGLFLRVVYVVEGDAVFLAFVGRHDDVRRFLKSH